MSCPDQVHWLTEREYMLDYFTKLLFPESLGKLEASLMLRDGHGPKTYSSLSMHLIIKQISFGVPTKGGEINSEGYQGP